MSRVAGIGGEQVEGRRAVVELLRAGRRRVKTISISDRAEHDDTLNEIVERGVGRVRTVSADDLARMSRTDAPQGVVATADPVPEADLDALLRDSAAFLVALDGVTDPRNLGAVMRVAETAGATGVLVPKHRTAHLTPAATKAAAGAIEYVAVAPVSGIPAALERARRADVWSVGLDEHGAQSVFDLDLGAQPIVVVLGAEGRGLARLTRERCDVLVRIPMHGRIQSLNVAAAASLACHVIAHRRSP